MAHTAAVVDVGSNTVRLLVARCEPHRVTPVHTDRVRLGLGHELERHGRISEAAIARTARSVLRLVGEAQRHGAATVDVHVTAPGRQAANGDELVEAIARTIQRRVRVLSPEEEGRLAFAGAVSLAEPRAAAVAVVDLGGASTEVAVGRPAGGPAWVRSVDLGALRLTSRLLQERPARREALDAAQAAVAEAFAGVTPPLPGAALAVGGSARALGRVLGAELGRVELAAAVDRLAGLDPLELAERFGIGKQRAHLLLAAALILSEVQRRLLVPLTVAEGGVREGALLLQARAAAAA